MAPWSAEHLVAPSLAQRARWVFEDSWVMTKRNLIVWWRVPAYIVFTVVQPLMFVLLFRYVFGGAIKVPVPGGYVNYLIPGIIGQTAGFASFSTAIGLSREISRGGIDRIRSMPTARAAFLVGRLTADTLRLAADGARDGGRGLCRRLPFQRRGRLRHRHDRPGHPAGPGRLLRLGLHRPGREGRGGRAGLRADLGVPVDFRLVRFRPPSRACPHGCRASPATSLSPR